VTDDVAGLIAAVDRHDWHSDDPEPGQGDDDFDELDPVGQLHRDGVAGLPASGVESGGQPQR
jgi:hypothetical protein